MFPPVGFFECCARWLSAVWALYVFSFAVRPAAVLIVCIATFLPMKRSRWSGTIERPKLLRFPCWVFMALSSKASSRGLVPQVLTTFENFCADLFCCLFLLSESRWRKPPFLRAFRSSGAVSSSECVFPAPRHFEPESAAEFEYSLAAIALLRSFDLAASV